MTITLTREEVQQVLDAFLGMGQRACDAMDGDAFHECSIAVSRLRARLAQPEPEPIAYKVGDATVYIKPPIYTAPPQRNEQEPAGWIYEDDEGRMMFSQMPQNSPLWEPVYKRNLKEKNT